MKNFYSVIILLVTILILFISSVLYIKNRYGEKSQDSICLRIYKLNNSANVVDNILNLPTRYFYDNLDIKIVFENEEVLITSYTDYSPISPKVRYIVNESFREDLYIINDQAQKRIIDSTKASNVQDITSELNLENVNSLNTVLGNNTSDQEKMWISFFASDSDILNDSSQYLIINDYQDIEFILKTKPINRNIPRPKEALINLEDLKISNKDDLFLMWTWNNGIYEVKIEKKSPNQITSIKSRFLGFLGNEPMAF